MKNKFYTEHIGGGNIVMKLIIFILGFRLQARGKIMISLKNKSANARVRRKTQRKNQT